MDRLQRTLLQADDETIVRQLEDWLRNPPSRGDELEQMRGKLEHLSRLAREALDRRKLGEFGGGSPPPRDDESGGGRRGSPGCCGSCCWCVLVKVDGHSGYLCTIDPPVIWKGENMWRFLRPEIETSTPACARREVV